MPHTTSTRYDADAQVTGTIAPDPDGNGPLRFAATRNKYDPAGRLVQTEHGQLAGWQPEWAAPSGWPGFHMERRIDREYDALDRKTREWVSDGVWAFNVTEHSYDLSGRLRCTAVRMNPDVWHIPLADKCVPGPVHAVHGPDRISGTLYDAAGRPIESWDGVGTPLQRREAHYTYNGNDQKLSLTDARGFRAEMTYDGHGRQSRWIFPSKTTPGVADASDNEQYAYDPNGNRTRLKKRDGSVLGFHYDALNRMTAKIVPERAGLSAAQTRDVYYDYDLRGLQTRARFDHIGGEGVTTAYDGFGRAISSTLAMAGTSRTIGHAYDGEGNRVRITHPDGSVFPYEYDGLGRLGRVFENGDPLVAFAYDPAGHRSSLTSGGTASAFAHDIAGRVVSLTHNLAGTSGDQIIGLGYNPASQIVTRTGTNDGYAWTGAVVVNRPYSANGQNQYIAVGPASFTYDPNGNLTSDGSTSFVYDVENRLVSASGAKSASLVYDPLGRLFQTSGGPAGVTRFLYDDDALIGEYNGAGSMGHRYLHGAAKGVDDPLIWWTAAAPGWRQALIADQQGSIIAVADRHGNPAALNTYDEYGIPGAGNHGRFQYTGQAWIPELGMYHYKARIYWPKHGRFLQTDPIGYDDQINFYAYVNNDPVNKVDPTGLAELNLTGDPADHVARYADYPGAFTISAHGSPFGITDNRRDTEKLSPERLLAYAQAAGYKPGGVTFLMSCMLGDTSARATFRPSFSQQYADLTGGPVIASPGIIDGVGNNRGEVDLRARKGFYVYRPGSRDPSFLTNRIRYNAETGAATISKDRTGSRIRDVETVCANPEKCGKSK